MNDDIIRMAREAGLGWDEKYHWYVSGEQLKCFAALVRADEREACAKECEKVDANPHVVLHHAVVCAAAIRARGDK